MYWPKFLTYGNWGGPGWSAGKFNNDPSLTDWTVEPIDAMDAAFKKHDYTYQHGSNRAIADYLLVEELLDMDVKGTWSNAYRVGAIIIFYVRSFF